MACRAGEESLRREQHRKAGEEYRALAEIPPPTLSRRPLLRARLWR